MSEKLKDEIIEKKFRENEAEAQEILKDTKKLDDFLIKMEDKLTDIPMAGKTLSMVPTMVQCVRDYARKEYTNIPTGTIVAIIAALIYVLSPLDIIPDALPVIGFADDAAVVAFCLNKVGEDLEEYKHWRDSK